ncbi:hypothetical protein PRZ48_008603 [Zasmidium cellare]|uniref:Uncharacterized protein n=1 Tax=Zasmidium cellare TaxID=395010 RepID=A0ABR0EGB6_ZASCE|nr:hypothetical protein PRZ48_008603 [Zasmidium cellare]
MQFTQLAALIATACLSTTALAAVPAASPTVKDLGTRDGYQILCPSAATRPQECFVKVSMLLVAVAMDALVLRKFE